MRSNSDVEPKSSVIDRRVEALWWTTTIDRRRRMYARLSIRGR